MPEPAGHPQRVSGGHNAPMDDAVRGYIDRITPKHRPLFDRLHWLILSVYPDAAVVLSYQIPTYKAGNRRLYVGVWKHGVSIYGWQQGRDAGSAPPRCPADPSFLYPGVEDKFQSRADVRAVSRIQNREHE